MSPVDPNLSPERLDVLATVQTPARGKSLALLYRHKEREMGAGPAWWVVPGVRLRRDRKWAVLAFGDATVALWPGATPLPAGRARADASSDQPDTTSRIAIWSMLFYSWVGGWMGG